jgi:hypothetical protein
VGLPSSGEGRTPGTGGFSLRTLTDWELPGCAITTFLFRKDILEANLDMSATKFDANNKKFSADVWNDAVFFEESLFGSDESFRSTWNRSTTPGSLASTAGENSPMTPPKENSMISFKLVPDDYAPGTNDQKRQKIYDYTEKDCLDKLKTTQNLPAVASIIDKLWASRPYICTPALFQKAIDHAEKALVAAKVLEARFKHEVAQIEAVELDAAKVEAAQIKILSTIEKEIAQFALESAVIKIEPLNKIEGPNTCAIH